MSYLLDTNVVSELRKGARCHSRVAAWFRSVTGDDIFLSVLTVGELRRGVESIRRRDPRQAAALSGWLRRIVTQYEGRILPIDANVAEAWGPMNVPDPLPVVDALLAATAKVHGLTLVTRNTKDAARTGVKLLNPFTD